MYSSQPEQIHRHRNFHAGQTAAPSPVKSTGEFCGLPLCHALHAAAGPIDPGSIMLAVSAVLASPASLASQLCRAHLSLADWRGENRELAAQRTPFTPLHPRGAVQQLLLHYIKGCTCTLSVQLRSSGAWLAWSS